MITIPLERLKNFKYSLSHNSLFYIPNYNQLVRALQGKEFTREDELRRDFIEYSHSEPIAIEYILDHCGTFYALIALTTSKRSRTKKWQCKARLFAVCAARQLPHLLRQEDIEVINVSERFANGQASQQELDEAASRAYWAVKDTKWSLGDESYYAAKSALATTEPSAFCAALSAMHDRSKSGRATLREKFREIFCNQERK